MALARAWSVYGGGASLRVAVLTAGIGDVTGNETLLPERAVVLGVRAISQEHPDITCQVIDLAQPPDHAKHAISPAHLLAELHTLAC